MKIFIIAASVAIVFLVTRADANDRDACRDFYKEANFEEAFEHCRRAAEDGDPLGQTALGFMYKYGRFVNQNEQEAVRWLELAAAQGYSLAIDALAKMQAEELASHIYNNCVISKSQNINNSVVREVRSICRTISENPTMLQRWRWGN